MKQTLMTKCRVESHEGLGQAQAKELKLSLELYASYVTLVENLMVNPFTCELALDDAHMFKCSSSCAYLEKQLLDSIVRSKLSYYDLQLEFIRTFVLYVVFHAKLKGELVENCDYVSSFLYASMKNLDGLIPSVQLLCFVLVAKLRKSSPSNYLDLWCLAIHRPPLLLLLVLSFLGNHFREMDRNFKPTCHSIHKEVHYHRPFDGEVVEPSTEFHPKTYLGNGETTKTKLTAPKQANLPPEVGQHTADGRSGATSQIWTEPYRQRTATPTVNDRSQRQRREFPPLGLREVWIQERILSKEGGWYDPGCAWNCRAIARSSHMSHG
ncbi:hypothetical protein M9H77_35928 [Catharanthus roseus]|uniref:Uncharacterized protein n=1 Tax=Catharanthus roseus TaxID=4058 RepID=A0ACB9ZQR0_CATRO|nr:hypothetical protein M9H77_35928 [Catharanthus roseus]